MFNSDKRKYYPIAIYIFAFNHVIPERESKANASLAS